MCFYVKTNPGNLKNLKMLEQLCFELFCCQMIFPKILTRDNLWQYRRFKDDFHTFSGQ